jgi:hypothetical protein
MISAQLQLGRRALAGPSKAEAERWRRPRRRAAAPRATLRELMDRMSHSTARAALIYLHGSDQRQQEIAQALSDLAEAEVMRRGERPRSQPTRTASGTYRARGGRNTP